MASSKNPSFKVKLKSISQKKRRKSDLVVMWYSIVDATVQIITAIHFLFLGVLERTRLLIWHDEVQDIRQFLKNYLPYVPDNFSYSWRDGKLLCILLNKLQPGCIPDAETLDHNYALRNMYHAFDILERKFGISPTATVEQLVVCVEGSHRKLLEILSQLKKETENKQVPPIHVEEVEIEKENQDPCSHLKSSVCKGTGLMVAFVGRRANFVIFSSAMTDISLVIEIKGPCNTVCRERITKRSPKKKNSTTLLEQSKPPFSRSNSYSEKNNNYGVERHKADDSEKNLIPLEYDISLDKISVTYIPLIEGQHVISILWYGQHLSDSPYVLKVEPNMEAKSLCTAAHSKSTFGFQDNSDDSANNKERKNGTVTIQKPVHKIERIGKVIKRRVLRHIVKIKDKDIIVDSNDIDHLAAALLKMEYEIQTDPSKSRRNSWGFAGDAERKISAIRQFCIPPQELEAQNMKLQGRSRSLTINTNPQMPLRRSNSFESDPLYFIKQTKLETVSEDSINICTLKLHENMDQDEEVFAYINEDFQTDEQGLGGNQTEMSNGNAEKVFMSLDESNTNSKENMLQSLLIEEEKEDPRNDLKAVSLALTKIDLTGSSEFSERSAVENEIEYNPDIYEDIENELKINAKSLSDDNPNDIPTSNGTVSKPDNFQNQNENKTCLNDKKEIVKIYNDLGGESNCDDREGSLIVMAEKFSNSAKRNVLFSESVFSKKNDFKETFQYLSPMADKSENWRLPLNKCSRNVHSWRQRKHNQNSFESRKYCKSCRKLETLNRKLIVRNKRVDKNNLYYSKTKNSEPLCTNFTVNGDSGIYENTKIDLNAMAENKNNSKNPQQNNLEFKNSKLKFFESPGKYSFYYYSHSSDDHTDPPEFMQSSNIETNSKTNRIKNDKMPLSSKMATFINYSENTNHNSLYNNSTLRLNYDSSNNLTSSALEFDNPMIKFKEVSDTNEYQIKEHNLVSLGQYNFNQFNPSTEKNKGSLIKNKIKKLERAMMRDSQKVNSKCSSRSSISSDTVNVKDKLTFWENLSRKDGKEQIEANFADDLKAEVNLIQNESFITDKKITEHDDSALREESAISEFFWHGDGPLKDTKNDITLNDEDISVYPEIKFPQEHSSFKMKRSFSDPVLIDPIRRDRLLFAQNPLNVLSRLNHVSSTDNMSSSGDYLESSIDDGLYSSDPFVSTEDEYIDDEIPGNPLLTHWGDLNIMKSLKTANISKHKEYCQFVDSEILKNQFQSVEICPSECKVFGIGTYYGYVAVKNRFQVLTKGAGNGNLSASVQGFGKHDVSFVSVKYKHKDIYEVTYQVLRPGLYLISLRWMEKPIVGSPFICKVTF